MVVEAVSKLNSSEITNASEANNVDIESDVEHRNQISLQHSR